MTPADRAKNTLHQCKHAKGACLECVTAAIVAAVKETRWECWQVANRKAQELLKEKYYSSERGNEAQAVAREIQALARGK